MNTWKAGASSVTEMRHLGAAPGTIAAAHTVAEYFTHHACTHDSIPEVEDFQNAWNGDHPTIKLSVDGQYGPLTQGALQNTLGTTNVPPNCFGGPAQLPPVVTTLPPVIVPGTVPSKPAASTSGASSNLPWILGGLLVVAGSFAAYTYSNKHKR